MEEITLEKLEFILKEHALWLKTKNSDKVVGQPANFTNTDLRHINLSGKDLREARLIGANLCGAKLEGTNLERAVLSYANLVGTNLIRANLDSAYLNSANLSCANLELAKLDYADLTNATLFHANLINASLKCTELSNANLNGTNLSKDEQVRLGMVLKEDMIGYKIALHWETRRYCIIKLIIPKGAIVFSINNYKCRTNKAKVVSITDLYDDNIERHKACSSYDHKFIYEVGQEVEIEDFNCQYNIECESGIHFFRTIEEAEEYSL